jgi:hypothetical protein
MSSELPTHRSNLVNSSTEKARNYIQSKEIPQLFEALMTGLMFKQPDDHLEYIINSLQRLKNQQQQNQNQNSVKWNTFITTNNDNDTSSSSSLPPLRDNANLNLNKEARVLSGNN